MNKKSRNNLLKYGITTFVAVLIASTVINLHGYDEAVTAADKYRILSDAFTIPGVVLMLCSLLVFVSNQGIFDGISYALRYAVRSLIPGLGHKQERYSDYIERKREKGGIAGYAFLFHVGLVFCLIALVFIGLFYSAYQA